MHGIGVKCWHDCGSAGHTFRCFSTWKLTSKHRAFLSVGTNFSENVIPYASWLKWVQSSYTERVSVLSYLNPTEGREEKKMERERELSHDSISEPLRTRKWEEIGRPGAAPRRLSSQLKEVCQRADIYLAHCKRKWENNNFWSTADDCRLRRNWLSSVKISLYLFRNWLRSF